MMISHVTGVLQYRTDYEFIWTQLGLRPRNAFPHTVRDIETHAACVMFSASVSTASKLIRNRRFEGHVESKGGYTLVTFTLSVTPQRCKRLTRYGVTVRVNVTSVYPS
jgi:hypothetical protein